MGDDQFARRLCLDRAHLRRRRCALVHPLRLDPGAVRAARGDRAGRLGPVPPFGHRPRRLRDRLGGRRGLYVRPQHQSRQDRSLHAGRLLRRLRRIVPGDRDLVRQCRHSASRRLYVELDRLGGHRRHLIARRDGGSRRLDLRCAHPAGDLLLLPHLRYRAAATAAVRRDHSSRGGEHRRAAGVARQEHAGALPVTAIPARLSLSRDDRPIFIAALFVVAILIAGTAYTLERFGSAPLLSPNYLLQQLQIGAFLGIVAAGMMVVILISQIDLSIPWTLTAAAMMATTVGGPWAIPIGLAVGLAVGVVNGLGVAYLRVPSMIFTLGVNAVMRGLMVAHTGGFAPQTGATGLMRTLASGHTFGVPNALFVWLAVSLIVVIILQRMALGRYIYAIGNKEAAAYLAGVNTRGVTVACFAISGVTAGLAGVLLAGYSQKAYQGMGDAYLLPAIAAVVIGGTNILGGRGRYLGTLVGVILIVLLNSVLSIMEMPEAGRQVIYGGVIILMLLVYGRGERVTS